MRIYHLFWSEDLGYFLLFGDRVVYPHWQSSLFDVENMVFIRKIVVYGKYDDEMNGKAFHKIFG